MLASDPLSLSAASLTVFVAGILQGLTGFGFVMVALPVLLFLLDPPRAVSLSQILGLTACLLMTGGLRKKLQLTETLILIAATLPGIWLGAAALMLWPPTIIKMLVGATVVGASIPMLSGFSRPFKHERLAAVGAGAISGLLQGSTGLGGPPAVILLTNQGWPREVFRASISLFLAVISIITLSLYRLSGVLTDDTALLAALLLPALVLGLFTGMRLAPKVNVQLFRKMVNLLVLATGLMALCTATLAYIGAPR